MKREKELERVVATQKKEMEMKESQDIPVCPTPDLNHRHPLKCPQKVHEIEEELTCEICAMRMWQVAILLNLSLAIGFGLGYGAWGYRLAAASAEIGAAQAQVERLTREREACFAGGHTGEQLWEGREIGRAHV